MRCIDFQIGHRVWIVVIACCEIVPRPASENDLVVNIAWVAGISVCSSKNMNAVLVEFESFTLGVCNSVQMRILHRCVGSVFDGIVTCANIPIAAE